MCRNDSEIFRLKGIDLFKVEEVGDSLEDGEPPTDTTDNNDKLKLRLRLCTVRLLGTK